MAQNKTYLDADGNEIKGLGAYLDEQGQIAGPAKGEANVQAKGGDTIGGRDPNAAPGVIDRVLSMLAPLANPQSASDFLGLILPSSEGLAAKAASTAGPVMESAGRGMARAGEALKPSSLPIAVADAVARGRVGEAATVAAAPYALRAAGKGVQAAGKALQRTEPLVKFEAPAVNVERPTAAVVQAAKEAAPAATEAAPKFAAAAIKARLNAAETKEYLRLLKAGKSADDAIGMIQAQRDLIQRLGLPTDKAVKIEQDYIAAHGRRQQ